MCIRDSCKDGDYLLNQRVGLLQLAKNVNQEFLQQILSSQRFENSMIACGQGAAQMNIGKGDVESYVLPYLSLIHIQMCIRDRKYIVLHEGDKCLMVLRPYQFYAVEKILDRVQTVSYTHLFVTDWNDVLCFGLLGNCMDTFSYGCQVNNFMPL